MVKLVQPYPNAPLYRVLVDGECVGWVRQNRRNRSQWSSGLDNGEEITWSDWTTKQDAIDAITC